MAEFDQFAEDYEQVLDDSLHMAGEGSEYFASYKAHYLARILGTDFEGRFLDFGCGVGLMTRFLGELLPHAELHGYDISEKSIGQIPARTRAAGTFTHRLTDLADDYGAIVAANVFHHIPPEIRQQTATALAQRLRPGGALILIEHNPLNPATRYIVATCALDENAVLLPVREARRTLTDAGLVVARRDYITFFPRRVRGLRALEPHIGWLPLGAQYAVMGRRDG